MLIGDLYNSGNNIVNFYQKVYALMRNLEKELQFKIHTDINWFPLCIFTAEKDTENLSLPLILDEIKINIKKHQELNWSIIPHDSPDEKLWIQVSLKIEYVKEFFPNG